MNLSYSLFIALRYLKSKKKHRGISFNTIISICGVAVGVTALLVVLSVMSGFHEDLQKKILGANAHVVVLSYRGGIADYQGVIERIKGAPHVVSVSPFVVGQVMVSSGKRAHGVFLRGIRLESETKTTDILSHIKEGGLERLTRPADVPWIVVGRELASMLGATLGETINVISPVGEVGPLGMLPKVKQFRMGAIFDVGMFEYDSSLALIDLKAAQEFFGYGDTVSGLELRLDDIYTAAEVRAAVERELGFPFHARDWMQMNKNLFSALKLEKFGMFVILILIVLVASFNIVSTLMMNVMEKQKEIAILKAMGATSRGVMLVFVFQGLFIGLIGTVLGIAGGYALGAALNHYEIIKLPADVYYLSKLPVKMKLIDFLVVSVSAVTISFLSTLYPSYRAAKLNPVEPLRYE